MLIITFMTSGKSSRSSHDTTGLDVSMKSPIVLLVNTEVSLAMWYFFLGVWYANEN